jgi:hypothetical protein
MILSAELFQQIVDGLRSDRDPVHGERRTTPRVGLRAQVDVLLNPGAPGPPAPPVRMRVRDVSASGIGLLHNRELLAGTEFVVRLPSGRAEQATVHIAYVVAHCRRAAIDTYTVGGRIVRVLGEDEAKQLAPRG